MADQVIQLGQGAVERPTDSPRRGERRLVKLVPTPFDTYAPCLWRSPLPARENNVLGHWCVVLLDRGHATSGKPTTVVIFVPDDLWERLPEDAVEW